MPVPPVPVLLSSICAAGRVRWGPRWSRRWAGPMYAADIDPGAVRCARRNLAGGGGRVYECDLFEPLPAALRGRVDVLLANVPYVPTEEIGLLPPEARVHEARVALDGGADGLDVLWRVAVEAFRRGGLLPRVERSEELYATVVIGSRGQYCSRIWRVWPRRL